MDVVIPKPVIPFELRQRLDIHRLQVRVCQLEHDNAALQMQVADKVAALESIRLTRDREELAAVLNTTHWRFDFDTNDFVRRPGGQLPLGTVPEAATMSPAPCPAMAILPPGIQVVDVEAMWLDDRLTFDVDPADVEDGVGVRVRFRYRSDEPRAKDTGTEHINRVYAKWPREIVYVPGADLKREV